MKIWLNQTKKSLLIGLLSFVLLFSLGQIASVKSSATSLKNSWQTEAAHCSRPVKAYHYLKLLAVKPVNGFCSCYAFAALVDAHTRYASHILKISYHPIPGDLLHAHHTHLKVAPGTDEDAHLIA